MTVVVIDFDELDNNAFDDYGDLPECFGCGDYACGSEECDFCPYEEDCKP